jgi:hypothetical protein
LMNFRIECGLIGCCRILFSYCFHFDDTNLHPVVRKVLTIYSSKSKIKSERRKSHLQS